MRARIAMQMRFPNVLPSNFIFSIIIHSRIKRKEFVKEFSFPIILNNLYLRSNLSKVISTIFIYEQISCYSTTTIKLINFDCKMKILFRNVEILSVF